MTEKTEHPQISISESNTHLINDKDEPLPPIRYTMPATIISSRIYKDDANREWGWGQYWVPGFFDEKWAVT